MNNVKVKGVRDLMADRGFQWKHIAKELMSSGIPGSWDNPQNIYNLVNGNVVPKDAYVYVALSKILDTNIYTILGRYSSLSVDIKESVGQKELVQETTSSIDFDDDDIF